MVEPLSDDCPECGAITAAFTNRHVRFCDNCGHELSMAIRLQAAIFETELEDDEGLVPRAASRCTEDRHLWILFDHQLIVRVECESDPRPRFCCFCGKRLPEELTEEWKKRLEEAVAKFKAEGN